LDVFAKAHVLGVRRPSGAPDHRDFQPSGHHGQTAVRPLRADGHGIVVEPENDRPIRTDEARLLVIANGIRLCLWPAISPFHATSTMIFMSVTRTGIAIRQKGVNQLRIPGHGRFSQGI
jgi:hypothetical protein